MLLSALSSALAGSTPSTTWRTVRDAAGGWVLERNGSPHVLHGVCYSPSEIGSAGPTELFDSGDAKYVGSFGDVFWDAPAEAPHLSWGALWGSGTAITGGRGAGRADLQAIASYGFNSVRVYSMLSRVFAIQRGVVSPAADCTRRTHAAFLDEAARHGLSVLVGIPMPIEMWHLSNRRGAHASLVSWWESVLEETARDLGSHPATLGFVLMNELDDAFNAFPGAARRHAPSPHRRGAAAPNPSGTPETDFFYGSAVKYARLVKRAAPGKLVGWALHDIPQWLGFASRASPRSPDGASLVAGQTYLAQISGAFDYFGFNTYQTSPAGLQAVMGSAGGGVIAGGGLSYGAPAIADQIKPLLLTEIGWAHSGVTAGEEVAQRAALVLRAAYLEHSRLMLGTFYFEFCDEWWKARAQTPIEDALWIDGAGPKLPLDELVPLTDSSLSSLFQLGIGAGACIVLLVLAARACCSGGEEARAGRKPPRRMRLADDEGEGSEVASSMTYSAVSKVQDS
ncbi:hypothetical protein EMIHUDRAFT_197432 [Emiliania huxleyi CCMP1516]|uniref:Glycoside hydrolase family 5 domain-containing protein n=2 Tax=Emiliania huxleyi TaxID=2903 RepID=A0A0D3IUB1_EMIH1|nr:hypothetical protein EMIHUDRAFT_197432 [Emiliania huxleyi CCMP1516]EOD14846.1 hypothetical protein EMIHUDRAFT_197432 [Emiliania huxleyi CCMP1516]|eukprot:XP_005767275.1 hypothetical protein EMIHUDRAFT_197432 [Emiliania huxleyi CCMP1516]